MSDGTKIEWTDATANVVNGCTVVSPGCTNCYAMKQAHRFPIRQGLTRPSPSGMTWTGEVRFSEPALQQVLRWKRPRRIFWNAHGDLFHKDVPVEWIDRCFAAMALTPQHTHQVLTKRPEQMRRYLSDVASCLPGGSTLQRIAIAAERMNGEGLAVADLRRRWPLPNVWPGISVEDQQRADERIPILLHTPAAVRWISAEPLLGPVDLVNIETMAFAGCELLDALRGEGKDFLGEQMRQFKQRIDWVVVGGESGPGSRPMHPDWARSLRDQCAAAGVPFLMKQWGNWAPLTIGLPAFFVYPDGRVLNGWDNPPVEPGIANMGRFTKKEAGRLLDGVQHDGYPA